MAVGLIMDFDDGTLEQYDQITEKMDLGGKAPPGCLFHWCGATDGGMRVVDVWESRETFDKFAQEKIGPFSAEVGAPEPKITEHQVHNSLAP